MNRRSFLFNLTLMNMLPVSTLLSRNSTVSKPNILFIAIDDLKPLLGCYGVEYVKTPNIDRIAESGMAFLNNHCQFAVCGPTRASLMTGLRPDSTRVWDLHTPMRNENPDILTLPQYFKQNGYETVAVGKIYDPRCVDKKYDPSSWSIPFIKDKDPAVMGYLNPETTKIITKRKNEAMAKGIKSHKKLQEYINLKPSVESMDVSDFDYLDGVFAERGLELMEQLSTSKKPFFLAVGFKKPHLPFVAPKKYWDLYDRTKIKIHPYQKPSKNGPPIHYHKFSELRSYTDIPNQGNLTPEKQKELVHGYYACVSYVDNLVGLLIDRLKALKLEKNTIIVLWGDHGWHLGDHNLWCKHTNFEQATRSPLIFSSSTMKEKGKTTSTPTEFVDIFPTLCELSGLKIPSHLQGLSLVPILNDSSKTVKKAAVSQFHRGDKIMGYAYRTDRYRYIEWLEQEFRKTSKKGRIFARELYDYEKDPMETVNQIDNPEYSAIVKDFENMIK